jgi:hypothetical protein
MENTFSQSHHYKDWQYFSSFFWEASHRKQHFLINKFQFSIASKESASPAEAAVGYGHITFCCSAQLLIKLR